MDGTRIDCHHQPLSAPSGNHGRSGRFGPSEPPGAHRGHTWRGGVRMTRCRFAVVVGIAPCQSPVMDGGAKGTRTPDLLVANETRYQLRHSPATNCAIAPRRPAGPVSIETLPSQAVAACCVSASSSPVGAIGSASEASGASAVTGTSALDDEATSGPDRSIVRTVLGARGLETYVGMVMGTGSQSGPDVITSDFSVLTGCRAPALDTS